MFHEGALIAFTLLSQLIAGTTFIYGMLFFLRRDSVSEIPSGFRLKTPEVLLLVGLLLAMSISFFHLGQFQRAVYAIANLKDSWLSREILSLALFSLSLFLLMLGRRFIGDKPGILSALVLLSILSGVALVFVMIKLYMIPAVASWDSWYTPFSFGLSSLILGLGAALIYLRCLSVDLNKALTLIHILMICLLAEALISTFNQSRLSHLSVIHDNPVLLGNIHLNLTLARIALMGSALLFLGLFRRRIRSQAGPSTGTLLLGLALFLVLLEQIAGRWLFFASYVKVGV